MAPWYSRPDSPRTVMEVPAEITLLRVDNVLVNGIFYNLEDTMDRLDWLGDHYDSYDRFACSLTIGTLTRIRNNRITLIDPFTREYRSLHDPICCEPVAWETWWERHGVRTATDENQPNEYIRLWSRFRREGRPADEIDLTHSDSDDEGLLTQAEF